MLHQRKHRHGANISSLNREKGENQQPKWSLRVTSLVCSSGAQGWDQGAEQTQSKITLNSHTYFAFPHSLLLLLVSHSPWMKPQWDRSFLAVTPSTNVFQLSYLIKPSRFSKRACEVKMNKFAFKDSRASSAEPLVTVQDIHALHPQPALKTQVRTPSFRQTRLSSFSSCYQQK